MDKEVKIIDEDTIEIKGTKYYAHERDAAYVCNYCELASISCKGIPCTPAKRKDGRNVYFTKEHLDMEKRITAPFGYEIEKVELIDGVAVVTYKEKERKLPKSFEEFCEMFPDYTGEYFIEPNNKDKIGQVLAMDGEKREDQNAELLPDRATAEAVLALCQLIQLRNAYNGDWVPDWKDGKQTKFVISFANNVIGSQYFAYSNSELLYFKTKELRDIFLFNFRPLIEKLKPLYGIKEGGEE